VLSQKDDDGYERPVAYFSRKLNDRESNWSTYEQECLALVEALKHFRHYVEGKKVYLFTDHKALIHLNKQPKLTAKQARWISFINLFNYSIGYREGCTNKIADALSRRPDHSQDREAVASQERLKLDLLETDDKLSTAREKLCYQCAICTIESTLIDAIRNAQQKDEQCSRVLRDEQTTR